MAVTAQQPDDLLTVTEVCDVLKVSRSALYALRYRGEAPPAIKVGRQLRWRRTDLDRWIAERPVIETTPS